MIPKYHGAKLTDIPDDQLGEVLSVAKKIASAQGLENYNILQNNGRLAHQVVDHVCRPLKFEGFEALSDDERSMTADGYIGALPRNPETERE